MTTSLWNLLREYKIVIPIIQRDYAQGRDIGKAPAIREKFLNAIFSALKKSVGSQLELDFIYGYTKENKYSSGEVSYSFIPLDGQQRLTTLFLLHWYFSVRENRNYEAIPVLSRFSYETRHSSNVFCNELVNFVPDNYDTPIKEIIINQPWFFTTWKNDPTVSSMLTMLNAIQEKDKEFQINDVWAKLVSQESRIVFHLLPMDKLGLPDDLYIKMNSRGKEITDFEYLKSQFSEILNKEQADEFNNKIDQVWSDQFWDLYKNATSSDIAKLVDDGFLRYFNFVTDILISKNNYKISSRESSTPEWRVVYESSENVSILFTFNFLKNSSSDEL